MSQTDDLLHRMLDPLGQALTPDVARKVISIRADAAAQERMDELADRCNEGSLSPEEDAEYRTLVAAASVIALLQAKARAILSANPAA